MVYHIKSILTQSCVKMMVHKFMSYFGVPLNDSFNIDQTSCDIHYFHSSIEKNVIPLFHFQLKILWGLFETNIQIYFVEPSVEFNHGELVWSPLLLKYFNHYDTLWYRYKLVAWANHNRAFHAKHRWYLFDHRYYWIVLLTTTPCGVGINLKLALITISHLMRNCTCFLFDTSFK